MLSIEEIKNVKFHKAGKGYDVDDVEAFIEDVIATIEQLQGEKNELVRKMGILAKKIEQYREDEETVRNALITSQKLSDNTIKEANNKASYIIKSAEKKSRAILTEAEMATEREKDKFEALHSETAKLRKELIAMYKKHLAMVEEFPTEDDVRAKREELDEKYPFEPIESILPETKEEDVDVVVVANVLDAAVEVSGIAHLGDAGAYPSEVAQKPQQEQIADERYGQEKGDSFQ